MLHLNRLAIDIFAQHDLSDANLRAFADDHLIRLANNNPGGIYDSMIATTTIAYTAYYGNMTTEAVKKAVAEGHTKDTRLAKAALMARLRKQNALLEFKFGQDSGIYQQFFPQGMNAFNTAGLDVLGLLLVPYITAASAHLQADYATEVDTITVLTTAYNDARTAQRVAFSAKNATATARRANRKALTKQMTRNFLIIASNNVDNIDRFDNLYDAGLLPLGNGVH